MEELTIRQMQDMQRVLQSQYQGIWSPLNPQEGRSHLLWMMEEMGEVIAIIKKRGEEAVMEDGRVRAAFVEELSDILMYYIDLTLCFGVSPEEFEAAYRQKHAANLGRDFVREHARYLEGGQTGRPDGEAALAPTAARPDGEADGAG